MAINKRLIKSNEGGVAVPTSFNTVLYTGNGTGQSISGLGFQPDLVWVKTRNRGYPFTHRLTDSVRGATKQLSSDTTDNESIENGVLSFNSDGFTLGNSAGFNISGDNFVAWCWKAGGSAVTNTDGTITSQVSANTEAGFSIVSYTGSVSANQTVGHGLDSKPDMIIVKNRSLGGESWAVYNSNLTADYHLILNTTQEAKNNVDWIWNDTEPTDSVFTVGQFGLTNQNPNEFIAYCWHSVAGFSKLGSYTGNGSTNGPTITIDFEPAFVMIKWTSGSGGNWQMMDNKRGADIQLYANLSNGEGPIYDGVDFLSNGFQLKTDYVEFNGSGQSYIYMAFANQF